MKSKKIIRAVRIVIISAVLATILSSCEGVNTAVFKFTVDPALTAISEDQERLTITITTKCVFGTYRYRGSSTVLGGVPTVCDESGNTIAYDPIPCAADMVWHRLGIGDVITRRWVFLKYRYDGSENYWEPGTYDILVEYAGDSEIFEDAVIIE